MSHYTHFTIEERESILIFMYQGLTISEMARRLGRNKSSVSREIKRNHRHLHPYSPHDAEERYHHARLKSIRHKILDDPGIFGLVKHLFMDKHWSPEQISERLKYENNCVSLSFNTIYRAIYNGRFNEGRCSSKVKLRHHGKRRRRHGQEEKRGKYQIDHRLNERPKVADKRARVGDWEADTVVGKVNRPCLVTLVDRKCRYLLCSKSHRKNAECVQRVMVELLKKQPVETITPDRGSEFSTHHKVASALGCDFYFPDPHHPWDRGTNENTNGLLREYFPKGSDFTHTSSQEIQCAVADLNLRPRKCLGWQTPYEVYFGRALHLT